jgi:hypothetical protein
MVYIIEDVKLNRLVFWEGCWLNRHKTVVMYSADTLSDGPVPKSMGSDDQRVWRPPRWFLRGFESADA